MQTINRLQSAWTSYGLAYILGRGVEEILIRSPITKKIYWDLAPRYYRHKYNRSNDFFAPLNPLKLIYINPGKITKFSGRDFTTGTERRSNIGKILSGDWDKTSNRELTDEYIYQSIQRRFDNKCSWKETKLYKIESERIKKTGKGIWHDCSTMNELEKRFKNIDKLFKDINDNGYECTFSRKDKENRAFLNCLLNEITVDINRNGEFLFVDGRHRLAIAKALELNKIPVFALVRHEKWMETRDAVYKDELKIEHPDMCEFKTEETYNSRE